MHLSKSLLSKTAIVMLACRDYESMELALACHMRFGTPEVPFFILQNCFGSYDALRTLQTARRYENLYPGRIRVIDHLGQASPYASIARALDMPELARFELILKVDDDAFPITEGWLESLLATFAAGAAEHGSRLAYVTPLINNNCWGFAEVLRLAGLENEFFANVARAHYAGVGKSRKILSSAEISTAANGTIWANADIARWLHQRTTLDPTRFIQACQGQTAVQIPSSERYSIGAILFRRTLWQDMNSGGNDDEHMMHQYCASKDRIILCDPSVPFVHMAYYPQREENRDIVQKARELYQHFAGIKHPIARYQTRDLEIEARLRWLESNGAGKYFGSVKLRIQSAVRKVLHKFGMTNKS